MNLSILFQKKLFLVRVSEVTVKIAPFVVIIYALLAGPDAGSWVIPMIVAFSPAYIITILVRCAKCGNTIYSVPHMTDPKRTEYRFSAFVFRHCPECGAALDSSRAYRLAWGSQTASAFSRQIVLAVGCLGLFATVVVAIAHYIFSVPVTMGKDLDSHAWSLPAFLSAFLTFSIVTVAVGLRMSNDAKSNPS